MDNVTWPIDEPTRIVVAGDWHGNDMAVRNAFTLALEVDAQLIVQLGDFGLWPGPMGAHYLDTLQTYAAHTGIPVAWVDGNHEDFDQLEQLPVQNGLRPVRQHVWHLPRGAAWTWNGVRFAALGGATSLDKPHRTIHRSWWPQEEINSADLDKARALGHVDVLLTHDAPAGVPVPGIAHRNYAEGLRAGWPQRELERAWDHRDRLASVMEDLTPGHLWHGHFHVRHTSTCDLHSQGPTQVEGLADDGSGPHRNLMVVTIEPHYLTITGVNEALYGGEDADE